jgi:hypothetical protein
MHHVRPQHSLFHGSIVASIVGQVAIHLGTMIYGVRLATETMGPELMRQVVRFHKKQKNADLAAEQALADAADAAVRGADSRGVSAAVAHNRANNNNNNNNNARVRA